jgi:hypothetical protein
MGGYQASYPPDVQAQAPLAIPIGYKTGLWPTYHPTTDPMINSDNLLLDGEPRVTMVSDWTAQIEFTTTIPTPAGRVYYGVYEPDPLLPWPRYLQSVKEDLVGSSTQHSVTFDISKLIGEDNLTDVNDMQAHGGGLIVYRIEIYQSGSLSSYYNQPSSARFYDRRFEFYDGQLVPTVIEGPFVDQVTETSAIISWDTDLPIDGVVRLEGVGDFWAPNSNDTHFEVALTGLMTGSTYTYSIRFAHGTGMLSTRQYFFRTPAQDTEQFTFVVLGDSRAGYGGGEYDYNGVNARALKNLTTHAFNRGAEFIVHTGDMINGYSTSVMDFQMELESYKDVIENVGHYIPIYEIMGNHEALMDSYDIPGHDWHASFDKEGADSAEAVFANEFVNPTNGPEPDNVAANTPPGKSLPPYRESVYYFDYGNSRFVVMNNNYWWSAYPEEFGGNLEGYVLDDQTAWLTEVFSQTKSDDSIEHLFLFAQEPLFPNSNHLQDGMWYSGGDPAQNDGLDRAYVSQRRDEIWSAFVGTGKAVAGNFGDEHNYSRAIVTQDRNDDDFEYPAWQLISGGAGAPLATQNPDTPWIDNVEKFSTQMHYTLLRVNGQEVRLEVYNINDRLIESVILKTAGGSLAFPTATPVEPLESTPRSSPTTWQKTFAAPGYAIGSSGVLSQTGQWPTYPTEPMTYSSDLLLGGEPQVTMISTWTAQIEFTTTIPVPAVRVYYGVYEPDPLLPWPRYNKSVQESLPGGITETQQHTVTLDISGLVGPDSFLDVNDMAAHGGGLIVYRIEMYQGQALSSHFDKAGSVRFYDRRFEFYDGQIVPTVSEGPFVDQISETSAVISWDTDLPVDGVVRVQGVGDFAAPNSNDTHFEVVLTGLTAASTYTYSAQVTDGSSTISTRQYFFRTPAQDTARFTFAVLGDSRAGEGGGEKNFNSVNALVLGNLAADAFNQGAEFIVHTGDLSNGYTTSVPDMQRKLESFKDVLEDVGRYIPIYELMGNHETLMNAYDVPDHDWPASFDKEGAESMEATFANEFVNPTNGPEPDNVAANTPPGKSLPPYQENAYYFDYGNSRFVMMNNDYWKSQYPEEFGGNLPGYVLDDQMAWLTEVFSQTKSDDSIEHLFLFGHEPPFPNSAHYKDAMWYQGGSPALNDGWNRTYVVERRDQIWQAFVGTGKAVTANFSHEHNYSRTFITQGQGTAKFGRPAWQIISGGAGAPFYTQKTDLPWSDAVEKFSTEMHYTMFKVDGSQVMLEVYNIDGQLIDSANLTPLGAMYDVYLPIVLRTSGG